MTKHQIDGLEIALIVFHGLIGCRFRPVSLDRGYNLHISILKCIGEAVVTFYGRRGSFQSQDLHHLSFAVQSRYDIFSHLMSHLVVVGTDEGRVFLRVGLSFKDDDRDALVVGPVDGWIDRGELVGGDDEQVDADVHQTVYLLYLTFGVVKGRGKAQLYALMEIGFHLHLRVLPVTPDIL